MENKENYCTIYLVRHGETEWNTQRRMQGHLDSPLTEKGILQAGEAAQDFGGVHFDAIFSSDSSRASHTAEIIKLERELIVQTSELLREKRFGKYEGSSIENFRISLKEKIEEAQKLSEEEQWTFKLDDDIETDEEVITRLIVKLREIALGYPGKTVLVVTHGACMRTFLLKLGYAKGSEFPHDSIGNASYIKVESDGVDFFLKELKGIKKPAGKE